MAVSRLKKSNYEATAKKPGRIENNVKYFIGKSLT